MGNHGIVDGIGVFGDVEILLHDAPRVGEKRPVGADAGAKFIGKSDVVAANEQPVAIGNSSLLQGSSTSPFSLVVAILWGRSLLG